MDNSGIVQKKKWFHGSFLSKKIDHRLKTYVLKWFLWQQLCNTLCGQLILLLEICRKEKSRSWALIDLRCKLYRGFCAWVGGGGGRLKASPGRDGVKPLQLLKE